MSLQIKVTAKRKPFIDRYYRDMPEPHTEIARLVDGKEFDYVSLMAQLKTKEDAIRLGVIIAMVAKSLPKG